MLFLLHVVIPRVWLSFLSDKHTCIYFVCAHIMSLNYFGQKDNKLVLRSTAPHGLALCSHEMYSLCWNCTEIFHAGAQIMIHNSYKLKGWILILTKNPKNSELAVSSFCLLLDNELHIFLSLMTVRIMWRRKKEREDGQVLTIKKSIILLEKAPASIPSHLLPRAWWTIYCWY